jgi:hypothetical protein
MSAFLGQLQKLLKLNALKLSILFYFIYYSVYDNK